MLTRRIKGKNIPFPELRGSLIGIKFPVLAEIKYDGEFCYLRVTKDSAFLVNKYGFIRQEFPRLNIIAKELRSNPMFNEAIFVGELFWNQGELGALYELLKHKEDDTLNIRIHDITRYNGIDLRQYPLIDRKEIMAQAGLTQRWTATNFLCDNDREILEVFDKAILNNYEGIVVKNLESKWTTGPCEWVKIKFKDRSDFFVKSVDPVQERIEVEVPHPCGGMTVVPVIVGVKAPNRYKSHIKIGMKVTIEHQGILPSGSLRHPILIPKSEWR